MLHAVTERSFSESFAREIDRVVLRGAGTDTEPKGILNQTGVTVTPLSAVISYGAISAAVEAVESVNHTPTALIAHPRTFGELDRLTEGGGSGQPLQPLPSYTRLERLSTTIVPINLGAGTATEVYIGNFAEVFIGMRTQIRIEVSRVGENAWGHLGVGFRAYMRMDVALAHPKAFTVLTSVSKGT